MSRELRSGRVKQSFYFTNLGNESSSWQNGLNPDQLFVLCDRPGDGRLLVNGLNPRVSVIVRVTVVFRKTVGKWFEPRSISDRPGDSCLQKDRTITQDKKRLHFSHYTLG